MITGKDILQDMYKAVEKICDATYLLERPASTSDTLKSFIVCALPAGIFNETMGDEGEYNYYTTVAQFEIYVRDKTSSKNLNAVDINLLDKKVKAVKNLFPIITEHCTFSKPTETLSISDGKQFHCTIIQAQVSTK